MSARRIFIGDIQGCLRELELLLAKLHYDPACDRLLPVGDLVNRGPDSLGVLRLLRQCNALAVLGNHDLHCLRVAHGQRALGERDTLGELLAAPDCAELLSWLAAAPLVRVMADVILVHAGLHPHWKAPFADLCGLDPLSAHPASDFATRVRYCDAEGKRPTSDWPVPALPFRPWYEHWEQQSSEPRSVVFGHWARLGLVDRPRCKGLDTGCVWGKALTAWIPEEKRFVAVPALRAWAPHSTTEEL